MKCGDAAVAANSICLLDALVVDTTARFRLQVVEKIVSRLAKMATPKDNQPPPVVLCARTVLTKWADMFPSCKEFVDAARSLRNTPSTPAAGHGARAPGDEEEQEVPAARPRDASTAASRPPGLSIQ